jgi:hypothetical protein
MAFREVVVTEIREVLRAWRGGAAAGGRQAGVDRKTARRYVAAAAEAGLVRDGGLAQLTDAKGGPFLVATPRSHHAGKRHSPRLLKHPDTE